MEPPAFFDRAGPFPLHVVADHVGALLTDHARANRSIVDVRPLALAEAGHLSFLDNKKYASQLERTRAEACLVAQGYADRVPEATMALVTKEPYRAFARALQLFYPSAMQPRAALASVTRDSALVSPSADIDETVTIEAGAIIGREARIGRGTTIAAGAVVGFRVAIGRDCYVGPAASVMHCIIGDRVLLHAGVRLGQDGFGFALGREGHAKIPQIGRVIIGDDVEIGANSTIDRGAMSDTVIGAGTKIDNLVQIGHNVIIGRHCVIVAQSGVAGSAELGDHVVMGAQSGVAGHVKVGAGAHIAGMAHVKDDVPAGARMGGTPAREFQDWAREVAAVRRLAARKR